MRAAGSMRGVGTEPFELRKGRAGSYKSMKVMCCLSTLNGWRYDSDGFEPRRGLQLLLLQDTALSPWRVGQKRGGA